MSDKSSNILLCGATGLIGQHITRAIVANASKFNNITIFTSPETLRNKKEHLNKLAHRGVRVITGDLTSEDDFKKACDGIDTIVSCLGRPAIHLQIPLIKTADEHPDVKRFFPSEYGTDIEYGPNSGNEKPHQQKLKVRAALKEVKNLEYTYVVTGPYGDADTPLYLSPNHGFEQAGSFNAKGRKAVLIDDGNSKISLTTMRDVGKLVVAALLHTEVSRNKALKVNSFTATPKQIVEEFERQTGGAPWDVSYTSLDELRQLETQAWENGSPTAGVLTLRRIWAEGGTLYDQRDNKLIGAEDGLDSLADAVEQAIKVQEAGASQ